MIHSKNLDIVIQKYKANPQEFAQEFNLTQIEAFLLDFALADLSKYGYAKTNSKRVADTLTSNGLPSGKAAHGTGYIVTIED